MQTLRAAAHPRSHAPAWERTSCRSAACSRLIREVTPDLFLTIHGAMAIRPDLSINHSTQAASQSSIGEPENWRPSVAPWAGSAGPRPEAGESRPTSRRSEHPRRRMQFGDREGAQFSQFQRHQASTKRTRNAHLARTGHLASVLDAIHPLLPTCDARPSSPEIWPPWSQSELRRDRIDSQRTA
jgi:hypothetical protein